MKKIIFTLLVFALAAFSAAAVTYGPLDIHSWKIVSVTPTSFSSVDGTVSLNLTNSRAKYTLSDISGVIYSKDGEMFVIGSADNFEIPKGTSTITVTGHGSLPSYMVLLSLLRNPSINPADYTADITVTVKRGIFKAHTVKLSRVPLSTFLK